MNLDLSTHTCSDIKRKRKNSPHRQMYIRKSKHQVIALTGAVINRKQPHQINNF